MACVFVYLMRNFLQAVKSSYMIQGIYGRRQASVETEDLRGRGEVRRLSMCE